MPVTEPAAPETDAPPDRATTPGKRRASSRRRISFWIGVGLILAGVGMLGYVGWQMWGTNWVSKKHQREAVSQLEKAWESGETKPPRLVPEGEASALIRIPKFGRSYVIPVFEGVATDVLSKGYGHFSATADPGEVGNYALAAHRITHGEPLRRMPELRPGDQVIVETAEATYTYVLDTDPNDLIIPFTGVWVLDALPKNPHEGGPQPAQRPGQRLITLTTCSELFHTDDRMIAFGHLEAVKLKGGADPTGSSPKAT